MNIYVGNLPFDVKEENLRKVFEPFGQVSSVKIVTDKYSGQPRGFGFVEMLDRAEAQAAIENLNGTELMGRKINVNEAHPRPDRKRTGGYGERTGGSGERTGGSGGRRGGRPGYGGGSRNRY